MDPYEHAQPALRAAQSLSKLIPELRRRVAAAEKAAEQAERAAQRAAAAASSAAHDADRMDDEADSLSQRAGYTISPDPGWRRAAEDAQGEADSASSAAQQARAEAQALQAQLQQALREAQATLSALGSATMAIEEDRHGITENRNALQQSRGGLQIEDARRGVDDAIHAAEDDLRRRERQGIELRKAMAELARAADLPQVGGLSEARRASSSNFRLAGAGNVSSEQIASGMYQAATRAGGNRSGQERPRTSTLPPERVVRDALAAARDPRMGRLARVDRSTMTAGARTGIKAQRWSLADPSSYARMHQAVTGGLDEWK